MTVTGPGGSGKTTLAQEAARQAVQPDTSGVIQFHDGACFVSLSSATAEQVLLTIAVALGVELPPTAVPVDTLIRVLRDRSLLLLVDNFEHVLETAPLLTKLLQAAPGLTICATSRTPLQLTGEHVYAVTGLSEQDAVTLFLERYAATAGGQSASQLDVPWSQTAAHICGYLDRLPLAIELAAARAPQFTAQGLAAQFEAATEHRLDLLTRGRRDAPDRQRSMHDTIAWSYHLLTSTEQRMLRGLAVFAGGGLLEHIATVLSMDAATAADALDTLVSNHLAAAQNNRFTLHALIREFGLARLRELDEETTTRAAHAEAFARLAQASHAILSAYEPVRAPQWLDRLEAEEDNLDAAIGWAISPTGTVSHAFRILSGAMIYWRIRSKRWLRVCEHIRRLVSWLEPDAPAAARAWVQFMYGFPPVTGEAAVNSSQRMVTLAHQAEDSELIALSHLSLGVDQNHVHHDGRGTPEIVFASTLATDNNIQMVADYALCYHAQAIRDYEHDPQRAWRMLDQRIKSGRLSIAAEAFLGDMQLETALHLLDFQFVINAARNALQAGPYLMTVPFGVPATYMLIEGLLGMGQYTEALRECATLCATTIDLGHITHAAVLALTARCCLFTGDVVGCGNTLKQASAVSQAADPTTGGFIDFLENPNVVPCMIAETAACLALAIDRQALADMLFVACTTARDTLRMPPQPYCAHAYARLRAKYGQPSERPPAPSSPIMLEEAMQYVDTVLAATSTITGRVAPAQGR